MSDKQPPQSNDSSDERSFDEILGELRQIVETLEAGDLPLERSLGEFERGVRLSRRGQQILDEAERRVEVLMRDGSTQPLD